MAGWIAGSRPHRTLPIRAQRADAKKIQELSKQGYDFADIRAIMKGEQPKGKPKRKAGGSRR